MGERMKVLVAHDGSPYADAALSERGLKTSVEIIEGDPWRVLDDEARGWGADSVFVGARGAGEAGEGAGLGGVSASLVRYAACSVEVVR